MIASLVVERDPLQCEDETHLRIEERRGRVLRERELAALLPQRALLFGELARVDRSLRHEGSVAHLAGAAS